MHFCLACDGFKSLVTAVRRWDLYGSCHGVCDDVDAYFLWPWQYLDCTLAAYIWSVTPI